MRISVDLDSKLLAELSLLADEGEAPCGNCTLTLRSDDVDRSYCVAQGDRSVFAHIDGAFSERITAFEDANKRPLLPEDMPQSPR